MTIATHLVQFALLCITLVSGAHSSVNSKSPANDSIQINKKELIFAHVVSVNLRTKNKRTRLE